MAAAVSKLMRNHDLVTVAAQVQVVTGFRTTLGLKGRLCVRMQPNHPTDDPLGVIASATGRSKVRHRRRHDRDQSGVGPG